MAKLNFAEAKTLLRKGIRDPIDFKDLRAKLPGWRKRPLQSLVFDVMAAMGIKTVPFAGRGRRPRLTRKPIQIDEYGTLNILDLLSGKEVWGRICLAGALLGEENFTGA